MVASLLVLALAALHLELLMASARPVPPADRPIVARPAYLLADNRVPPGNIVTGSSTESYIILYTAVDEKTSHPI